MKIITFSLFLPTATLQLWNRILWILLLPPATLWINHTDEHKEYSQNSQSLNSENREVVGCVTKKETLFCLVIFSVSVLSKCFEKSITIWLYQTRLHHRGFRENMICFDFFSGQEIYIFLASQINCCCRAVQGQPSKFTWINTVTSFRTQLKSHKDLKGAVVFTRSCFTIKLI